MLKEFTNKATTVAAFFFITILLLSTTKISAQYGWDIPNTSTQPMIIKVPKITGSEPITPLTTELSDANNNLLTTQTLAPGQELELAPNTRVTIIIPQEQLALWQESRLLVTTPEGSEELMIKSFTSELEEQAIPTTIPNEATATNTNTLETTANSVATPTTKEAEETENQLKTNKEEFAKLTASIADLNERISAAEKRGAAAHDAPPQKSPEDYTAIVIEEESKVNQTQSNEKEQEIKKRLEYTIQQRQKLLKMHEELEQKKADMLRKKEKEEQEAAAQKAEVARKEKQRKLNQYQELKNKSEAIRINIEVKNRQIQENNIELTNVVSSLHDTKTQYEYLAEGWENFYHQNAPIEIAQNSATTLAEAEQVTASATEPKREVEATPDEVLQKLERKSKETLQKTIAQLKQQRELLKEREEHLKKELMLLQEQQEATEAELNSMSIQLNTMVPLTIATTEAPEVTTEQEPPKKHSWLLSFWPRSNK